MTTPDADPAASALDEIRRLEQAATRGPWETEEGDDHWQLFGAVTPHMHPLQLIKAPKHGTPYAEYWPDEADSAFIAASRTAVPRLLAAVDAALASHVKAVIEDVQPEPFRYCRTCSGHPAWPCPEVAAITAALAGTQLSGDENHVRPA